MPTSQIRERITEYELAAQVAYVGGDRRKIKGSVSMITWNFTVCTVKALISLVAWGRRSWRQ